MNFFRNLLADVAVPQKPFTGKTLDSVEIFIIIVICLAVVVLAAIIFAVVKHFLNKRLF